MEYLYELYFISVLILLLISIRFSALYWFDIESNELQIIDKIKKNIIKENKENINVRDNRDSIQLNEEKDEYKIKDRKKILFKSNENNINLKSIKKEDMRKIKITTKKILKHEKILGRKKFLELKDSSENSFLIKNYYTSKASHKKDLISLIPSTNDKFIIKRKKSKKKEEEIQATVKKDFNVEEIDEITLESLNKDYVENIINDNYEKNLKERKKMLQKIGKNVNHIKESIMDITRMNGDTRERKDHEPPNRKLEWGTGIIQRRTKRQQLRRIEDES